MGGLSRWSGGLVEHYGARLPLTIGPTVAAAGLALLASSSLSGSYWAAFFPGMAVLGLGMSVSVAPLTTTVMGSVEDKRAGTASGVNNAISRIGAMLAVALLGAVAAGNFGSALDARLNDLQVASEVRLSLKAQAAKLAGAQMPSQVQGEQRLAVERALSESFVQTFRVVMLVSAWVALGSALCAWLTAAPITARKG
jgi:MFS family permease